MKPFLLGNHEPQHQKMAGETKLSVLLSTMAPKLKEGVFVFCTVPSSSAIPLAAIGSFREVEGLTLILPQAKADELGLTYDGVMRWISLQVHSALAAVGLTAAIANALAEANISCNVVAAFYHDHLFVPERDAEEVLAVLEALAEKSES